MAFATANVVRDNGGSNNILRGSWTGSVGDSAGTVTGRGRALSADFSPHLTAGPDNKIPTQISKSSGVWTVTVPYNQAVTAGTFEIKFK